MVLLFQPLTWNGLKVGDHVPGLEAKGAVVDDLTSTLQQQHRVKGLRACMKVLKHMCCRFWMLFLCWFDIIVIGHVFHDWHRIRGRVCREHLQSSNAQKEL